MSTISTAPRTVGSECDRRTLFAHPRRPGTSRTGCAPAGKTMMFRVGSSMTGLVGPTC
ncbi:hypothetical protein SK854_36385 [Lentzea sp. BCCO 10_0061]|uniref:Uncharacterized protein n=1 Tax=Lentzea sokolovensis TaxID=3095429 RepID=A0ABU4V778_9PSEU|nr:hypothetical protein [Lentzea sp. BCCO 10_0061]MDX8147637.1 hypothetical protein [Lentzea sp. BCCO 10_0061]